MLPTKVDALDDGLNVGHAVQSGFILNPVLDGVLNAFAEAIRDVELGEDCDELCIDGGDAGGTLAAFFVAAIMGETAIEGGLALVVVVRAHATIVVIDQASGFGSDAAGAVEAIMEEVGAHSGGFAAMHDHACANLLAEVEQLIRDETEVPALKPFFTSAAGLAAMAERAAVEGVGVGHASGV